MVGGWTYNSWLGGQKGNPNEEAYFKSFDRLHDPGRIGCFRAD
jgi:hypothetical protein